MNWRLRILRGTIYSQVPFAGGLRALKRRLRPPSGESSSTPFAVEDGLRQIALLRRAGVPERGVLLEMGTGWLPVIPLLFHMAGEYRFLLTDLERLMDASGIATARGAIERRIGRVAEGLGLSEAEALARLARPFEPEYRAPCDVRSLPADLCDLLISRCVFEHIPPEPLAGCIAAMRRIVRPGGAMCHLVDNSDHWQHAHPPRSRIQFLTWPQGGLVERFSRLNHYGYTNRLRHSDYAAMFAAAGWETLADAADVDPGALRDAARLPIAPPFAGRPPADLAALTSVFVLRRPAADAQAA